MIVLGRDDEFLKLCTRLTTDTMITANVITVVPKSLRRLDCIDYWMHRELNLDDSLGRFPALSGTSKAHDIESTRCLNHTFKVDSKLRENVARTLRQLSNL